MKRFTFWRNAIIAETYVVEAENEDAAREMLMDGYTDPVHSEFIDWHGDFEIEDVEELDPLYRMVKDYKLSEEQKDQIRNSSVPKLIFG